jgi:hypothetical protein
VARQTGTLCNILTFGTFVGLTASKRTSKETRVRLGGRFVRYFFGLRLLLVGLGVEPVLSAARQPLIYPYSIFIALRSVAQRGRDVDQQSRVLANAASSPKKRVRGPAGALIPPKLAALTVLMHCSAACHCTAHPISRLSLDGLLHCNLPLPTTSYPTYTSTPSQSQQVAPPFPAFFLIIIASSPTSLLSFSFPCRSPPTQLRCNLYIHNGG